ncbi:MAG TPA: S53 family peptidase [Bryobacteraceae bacterium]|jgi:kumamolisin|nr:S53 family peptidase [Bryobacteraceae bacterium]
MPAHVKLLGSERSHPRNSVPAGDIHPDKNIELTLTLRRNPAGARHPRHAGRLSRQEFVKSHGADSSDIQKVKAFAAAHELAVVRVNPPARTVQIAGPVGKLAELFGANLRLSKLEGAVYRTREGSLHVPAELADCVIGVFGFDNRPVAQPHFHSRDLAHAAKTYTPVEVAQLYNFPPNKGKGQTIAMIELGGGYQDSDLETYWKRVGVNPVSIVPVSVGGAQNAPDGDPDGADGEVMLDIEVAGAMAPAATIAVYFAPNTDEGFLNAINAAIHDSVCKPSVISISWGSAENEWTAQSKNAFNAAFQDAAALGITVCAAAGDSGSSDGENDRQPHVDFPASSPWVLACGGTKLLSANGKITSETVWNEGAWGGATGGGVSAYFSQPDYQAQANVPKPSGTANSSGRGVPDVAGNADPQTGYRVLVDGQESAVGGTSAVAPLWAALIALCNEQLGKNLGWFHPVLYSTLAGTDAFRDITVGNNGAYHATKGWDCCTGLGTPNGLAILNALKQQMK